MLNFVSTFKQFILLATLFLCGCSTMVAVEPSKIQKLSNVQIVRVVTPPLTKNTWSKSLFKAYPGLMEYVIYQNSDKPIGLSSPDIPDFGLILAKEIQSRFTEKNWWPSMTLMNKPVNSINELSSGNFLTIEFEDMGISGGGQFFTTVRIKLRDEKNLLIWDKRSSYNGVYSSVGDSIETRLLKGQPLVEEEFQHAASYIVKDLIESVQSDII